VWWQSISALAPGLLPGLYIINGHGDRQFGMVIRIGGAPADYQQWTIGPLVPLAVRRISLLVSMVLLGVAGAISRIARRSLPE
jgi:hypothetical protein